MLEHLKRLAGVSPQPGDIVVPIWVTLIGVAAGIFLINTVIDTNILGEIAIVAFTSAAVTFVWLAVNARRRNQASRGR